MDGQVDEAAADVEISSAAGLAGLAGDLGAAGLHVSADRGSVEVYPLG